MERFGPTVTQTTFKGILREKRKRKGRLNNPSSTRLVVNFGGVIAPSIGRASTKCISAVGVFRAKVVV